MEIIITGGRGFIGSAFVERAMELGHSVIDYDKMGRSSHQTLPWDNHQNYKFFPIDINDLEELPDCDVIVHFAAESHVDKSIEDPISTIKDNVLGTQNLLELVRKKHTSRPIFVQISTDEVYGDEDKPHLETDVLNPSNPYAASKAAAEYLVRSYARTYDIDFIITRCCNNYGPRQHHEKLIPKILKSIHTNSLVPLHGDASYRRDWIYVYDHVDAIFLLIEKNVRGVFNISNNNILSNFEVFTHVLSWYDRVPQRGKNFRFVKNRVGQDQIYRVDSEKIRSLGWKPKHPSGLFNFSK